MFGEVGKVQDVRSGELLLHLVEFVGAHGIEVASLQLAFEHLRFLLLVEEHGDAAEVVRDHAVVLFVD